MGKQPQQAGAGAGRSYRGASIREVASGLLPWLPPPCCSPSTGPATAACDPPLRQLPLALLVHFMGCMWADVFGTN